MIVIEMPWPKVDKKSPNTKAHTYREVVRQACEDRGVESVKGRVSVFISYRPSEGSRASLGDNARAVLDGLVSGHAIEQLSQVQDLRIVRDESMPPSWIKIQIQELRK